MIKVTIIHWLVIALKLLKIQAGLLSLDRNALNSIAAKITGDISQPGIGQSVQGYFADVAQACRDYTSFQLVSPKIKTLLDENRERKEWCLQMDFLKYAFDQLRRFVDVDHEEDIVLRREVRLSLNRLQGNQVFNTLSDDFAKHKKLWTSVGLKFIFEGDCRHEYFIKDMQFVLKQLTFGKVFIQCKVSIQTIASRAQSANEKSIAVHLEQDYSMQVSLETELMIEKLNEQFGELLQRKPVFVNIKSRMMLIVSLAHKDLGYFESISLDQSVKSVLPFIKDLYIQAYYETNSDAIDNMLQMLVGYEFGFQSVTVGYKVLRLMPSEDRVSSIYQRMKFRCGTYINALKLSFESKDFAKYGEISKWESQLLDAPVVPGSTFVRVRYVEEFIELLSDLAQIRQHQGAPTNAVGDLKIGLQVSKSDLNLIINKLIPNLVNIKARSIQVFLQLSSMPIYMIIQQIQAAVKSLQHQDCSIKLYIKTAIDCSLMVSV
ncbi:hypothetical protein MP228_000428 [Amoeboaphelidium protococcarum]|nr:hypothetical protein MP228_000428 [Amoeboaphelidium protococcarum]